MTRFTIISLFAIFHVNMYAQTGETELYEELEKQEKNLELVYKKLESKISEIDKMQLGESQKYWEEFINANCSFKSQEKSEGGVISNKMKIGCKIESTLSRIDELSSLIDGF